MLWCYRQHWPIFNLVLVLSLLTFIWLYYIDFWYHFRLETSILMNRIRQLKDASNWCLSDGGRLLSKLFVSRGFFLRVAYIGTYSHIWLWPMQYRTSFRLVPNYVAWWQGHMWTTYSVPFDGDMAESRTWNLVYHESNTLITMPYVGV